MTASALPLGTKREQGAVVFIQAGLGGSLIFASPGPNGINDSPLKLEQSPPVSSVSIGIHPYRGIVSLNTRRGSRSRGSFATLNGSCVLPSRSCRDTPRQLLTCLPARFLQENKCYARRTMAPTPKCPVNEIEMQLATRKSPKTTCTISVLKWAAHRYREHDGFLQPWTCQRSAATS